MVVTLRSGREIEAEKKKRRKILKKLREKKLEKKTSSAVQIYLKILKKKEVQTEQHVER